MLQAGEGYLWTTEDGHAETVKPRLTAGLFSESSMKLLTIVEHLPDEHLLSPVFSLAKPSKRKEGAHVPGMNSFSSGWGDIAFTISFGQELRDAPDNSVSSPAFPEVADALNWLWDTIGDCPSVYVLRNMRLIADVVGWRELISVSVGLAEEIRQRIVDRGKVTGVVRE